MKTTFKMLLPVLLVALVVAAADKPPGRIATIDLKRAFEKYYRHDMAMKAVEQERADIEKKLKSLEAEGLKLTEERDKLSKDLGDPMITSQERDTIRGKLDSKKLEIDAKQNEYRTYGTHAEQQLGVLQERVTEQLVKDIRTAVDAKARSAGYSLVIDAAAVIYNTGENDITDEIIKQINAAAPVSDVPADPARTADKPDKKN
jgi:Skp family chaperone for outer membrane proteins